MMTRVLLAALVSLVSSCKKPDDSPTPAERRVNTLLRCPFVVHPYLYEVEKDHKTSYLLGSWHLGVSLSKMPPYVRGHVRDAKQAVFEIAPDDKSHAPLEAIDLPAALGDELWQKYTRLVGHTLARRSAHAHPATAALVLATLHLDVSASLDKEIMDQISEEHVPAQGLETARFQHELLAKRLDLRLLRATLSQAREDEDDDEVSLLTQYCMGTQTTPGMTAKTRTEMLAAGYTANELDAMDEEMIYARNASWMTRLELLLQTDHTLVVVGAGHVLGPRGVPALLAARGYHVTRIEK